MVDKSALKISVTWDWGLVVGAKCSCHWQLKCDFFQISGTSRPITDHLPYLSYSWNVRRTMKDASCASDLGGRWRYPAHGSYWDSLGGLSRGHCSPSYSVHVPKLTAITGTNGNLERGQEWRWFLAARNSWGGKLHVLYAGPQHLVCKPESRCLSLAMLDCPPSPQILLLSFSVVMEDKHCPTWLSGSSYRFPCGQIQHRSTCEWTATWLSSHVGLFICVWMCILIMCI